MKWVALVLPVLGLVACSHPQTQAPAAVPPPTIASASLTSASLNVASPAAPTPIATPQKSERDQPIVLMSDWETTFPDAAMVFGQWAKDHPDTAASLAVFQQADPMKMKSLIDWAVSDQGDPVGSFLMNRWGWDSLRAIADRDPDGLQAFLGAVRTATTAATDLGRQAGSMTYLANHAHALAAANPEKEMAKRPLTHDWHPQGWQPQGATP